jgi:hypothetical protein
LALQALLKWGEAPATARKALNYITARKGASGTWGTTQATIMALRALLLATEKGSADAQGTVEVSINGKPVETLKLTEDNNELFHQFVFKDIAANGANSVGIRFTGQGGLPSGPAADPQQVADGQAPAASDAQALLSQENREADQTESEVRQTANGG